MRRGYDRSCGKIQCIDLVLRTLIIENKTLITRRLKFFVKNWRLSTSMEPHGTHMESTKKRPPTRPFLAILTKSKTRQKELRQNIYQLSYGPTK